MVLVCLLTVFLFLFLLFLTFLLVLCGFGDDLGLSRLLTCMHCLGLWLKGWGGSQFSALPYFITCVW